jgi:D-3-phosphoglycerate dehydrogenase
MAQVLLTQGIHESAQAQLAQLAKVVIAPNTEAQTLRQLAGTCEVMVVRCTVPADLFDAAPGLRGIVRHGAGADMIPLEAASQRGVLVSNVPGANANAVVEHTLAGMIQLSRRSQLVSETLQRGSAWNAARALAEQGMELRGRTVGIIGYGHVGRPLAQLCGAGLGMQVLVNRHSQAAVDAPATSVSLQELLTRSDVVVVACPLTERTRGLIGPAEIQRMRDGALLLNIGRGAVVDEAALLQALRSGKLGGAALDVFDQQPLPAAHSFWDAPNLILTPHAAGLSAQGMVAMGEGVVRAVKHLLRGRMPPHCLNPQAWPAFVKRLSLHEMRSG